MKFLIVLIAIGCASASFYDALDRASDDLLGDFVLGMEKSPSLKEVIGVTYSEEAQQLEEDLKTEIAKTLKERFDSILQKIKETVEHGKQVGNEIIQKAKDLAERLRELGEHAGEKSKDLLESFKNKAKDWIKHALEKLGLSRRSFLNEIQEMLLQEFDLNNVIDNLKRKLIEKLDIQAIREYVKKVFGQLSTTGESILKALQVQGLSAVRDLLSNILPRRISESRELGVRVIGQRSATIVIAKAACMLIKHVGLGWGGSKLQAWIDGNVESKWRGTLSKALKLGIPTLKFVLGRFCYASAAPSGPPQTYSVGVIDLWLKIKDFFKGIGIEFQSRFFQFAVWLKEVVRGGVENIKDQLEKVKEVARQVVANGKTLTKEAGEEALEFFRPYKEDLGTVWEELVEAVKRAVGRQI